ncbi:hypothetical protein P152DRAFT_295212 [Eremomyces bilateralis CBS 781.70]|uniref:Uncharacterized protein n=1 Tax=Eremomyces bilateralis CBS 781.70 TaxID=1392243 RepID=A0A6G1G745_9PEZI|nr:uncharacterized protein P152DRAFT_295212 [Eremomyces bilateralis CBS 781.70]KAF1813868.1 hypothetical protein P152DRAFT_295212 [Eremomyces bilateralis CBS 781.70]
MEEYFYSPDLRHKISRHIRHSIGQHDKSYSPLSHEALLLRDTRLRVTCAVDSTHATSRDGPFTELESGSCGQGGYFDLVPNNRRSPAPRILAPFAVDGAKSHR